MVTLFRRFKTFTVLAVASALLSGGALATACSSNPASTPSQQPTAGAVTSHAIHVFVRHSDGTANLVDFGPATDLTPSSSAGDLESRTTASLGRHPRTTKQSAEDAGVLEGLPPSTVADPGTDIQATAWVLAARAADACTFSNTNAYYMPAQLPPWGYHDGFTNFYVFATNGGYPDCARRVFLEQDLVCIADKLAQIADAVSDVVWPPLGTEICPAGANGSNGTFDYGEVDAAALGSEYCSTWDIPPQADSDRFIARDLAIHTLAMIPMLETYQDGLGETCASAFAQVAWQDGILSNGSLVPFFPVSSSNQGFISDVFGVTLAPSPSTQASPVVPIFPPSNQPYVDANDNNYMPAIAQTALDIEAQVLRTGGRLLHDLIRRDVYSDLAASAQASAQALDPLAGNEAAWGLESAGSTPYGTISHAARVLLGRWEIGAPSATSGLRASVADPECENTAELDLLPGAFADYSSRYLDRQIRTPGEQTAVTLVERSGIVIPSCMLSGTSGGSLSQALLGQLLLAEQVQNNLPVPPSSAALSAVLANVSGAELTFAFQRALLTWQLLTNTTTSEEADGGTAPCSGSTSPLTADANGDLPAGLAMARYPAGWSGALAGTPLINSTCPSGGSGSCATVASLLGIVVNGGLSRSRLATDPIARAGGMLEASQCADTTPQWDEWGNPSTTWNASLLRGGNSAYLAPVMFQDAFEIGQAFERQLNLLRVAATPLKTYQDPVNVAKGGVAELRSWAGSTVVHAEPIGNIEEQWTGFNVTVGGMSYTNDFGFNLPSGQQGTISLSLQQQTALLNSFGFVYGPPWVAECAAGVRPDCPADFSTHYVQTGNAVADVTHGTDFSGHAYTASGVPDNAFELTVSLSNAPSQFQGIPVTNVATPTSPSSKHLYMVLLHDPSNPMGHGRVLGAITLRYYPQYIEGGIPGSLPVVTGFVNAPMQSELVQDAIGLGAWVGARPPALGDPSAAQSSGYCVDGVPRNLFVPLDNELVSGTQTYEDSWQAYLSLAQTAAQTADALGQQLIANDLQISENQQAAEEQLANLCGDFGALSSASVGTDGTITADPADPTTQSCLGVGADGGSDLVDIVFLGTLPTNIQNDLLNNTDPTPDIKDALHCASDAGVATSAVALCQKQFLTVDALNIDNRDGGIDDGGDAGPSLLSSGCQDLTRGTAPYLRTNFSAQNYLSDLQDPSQTPAAMQSVVSELHLVVDLHNNWQLQYGSETIMDSRDVRYWPACLNGPTSCLSPTLPDAGASTASATEDAGASVTITTGAMAPLWSTVFRNCSPGVSPWFTNLGATPAALGVCDGAQGPAAELNLLKWRVTQAMWMLAASSGVLPSNMVSQPIPARFIDPVTNPYPSVSGHSTDTNGSATLLTPVYTYPDGVSNYYVGKVVSASSCPDPSLNCWTLDPTYAGSTTGDVRLMGTMFDIDPAFSSGIFTSTSEIPAWYRDLYSLNSVNGVHPLTKHTVAPNSSAIFDPCGVTVGGASQIGGTQNPAASCSGSIPDGGSITPNPVSMATLLSVGQGLDGIACSATSGEPSTGHPQAEWWQDVVGVKLGLVSQYVLLSSPINLTDAKGTTLSGALQPSLTTSISQIAGGGGSVWPLEDTPPVGIDGWQICSSGTCWGSGHSWPLYVNEPDGGNVSTAASPFLDTTANWDISVGGQNVTETTTQWYPGTAVDIFTPSQWPVGVRALAFAGFGAAPNGTCGALTLMLQASALACTPSPSNAVMAANLTAAPPVTHLSDVATLEAWLAGASSQVRAHVDGFYVQEIPREVVSDFKNGTVGSGALGGTKGQALLTMEQQIQQFPISWASIGSDLSQLSSAIAIANDAIVGAQLNEQTADGSLALQTIQTQGNMSLAVDNFLQDVASAAGSAYSTFGGSLAVVPVAVLSLTDSLSTGNQELAQIQNLQNAAGQTEDNQVDQALAQLVSVTGPLWADVQKQIDNLRAYAAQIDASGQTIKQTQNQAAYQLAVGTGSDFVSIAGQEVPIPVDTVLRRQSSATEQRYQAALTNAKALAYMARRAIEQRIGVPLDALTQQVGPVDAPASWADDICSLQGVNYSALSNALPSTYADGGVVDGGGIGGAQDQQVISDFANAWVGDYVAKLQNFVTYYNVQYPSHQGEDTAALSLRYDLLGPSAQCTVQAPNVLTNSGDLSSVSGTSWQLAPCAESYGKCLAVIGGYALPTPGGPAGAQAVTLFSSPDGGVDSTFSSTGTGVTWLLDVAVTAPSEDAGASQPVFGDGDGGDEAGAIASPQALVSNVVMQTVALSAGSYVLSWWDQARDANGDIIWAGGVTADGGTVTEPKYMVQILTASGQPFQAPISIQPFEPPQVGSAGGGSLWSSRRSLAFTIANAGTYSVAFSASGLADIPGSVAIADVQLEASPNGEPSTYVATSGTTMVQGLDCPMTDADFRASFTHTCNASGQCYYDLTTPFVVDTSQLDGSPLSAKLAGGNYNYRQITTALNLVGTSVHDCTNDPTPDCYGSGYVQYNLTHDAQNAGIVGYDGNSRIFDFGVANVAGGKALAAEQYITIPMSSNDQNLISQPGIEHVEFGGRPLDGTYYLRIWDSPDLNWNALQDVQLIADYEYWSQIQNTTMSDIRTRVHPQSLRRTPIKAIIRKRHGRR